MRRRILRRTVNIRSPVATPRKADAKDRRRFAAEARAVDIVNQYDQIQAGGDYSELAPKLLAAADDFGLAHDVYQQALSLESAVKAYDALDQNDRALNIVQKALALRREINDLRGQSNALYLMGQTYNALGLREKRLLPIARHLLCSARQRTGAARQPFYPGSVLSRTLSTTTAWPLTIGSRH